MATLMNKPATEQMHIYYFIDKQNNLKIYSNKMLKYPRNYYKKWEMIKV